MSEIYEPTTIQPIETLSIRTLSEEINNGHKTVLQGGKKNKTNINFFLHRVKVHTFGYYDRYNFIIFEPDPCNPMSKDNIFWSFEQLSPIEYEPGNIVSLKYNVHILPCFENRIVCVIQGKN